MNKNQRAGLGFLGGLLVLTGLTWTLQGLGVLPGSVMTGVTLWAIIGPIVAVIGAFLVTGGPSEAVDSDGENHHKHARPSRSHVSRGSITSASA